MKCPICGKESDGVYKPFCSKKCADVDLGRWLKEGYVVHTNEVPTHEDFASVNAGDAESDD